MFVYLETILDACSRRCVGWNLSARMDTNVALGALEEALATREVKPGLIHHSDRGVQYASMAYTERLPSIGVQISKELRGWVAFLRTTPTSTGTLRVASTIASYARSARAFCNWLLRQGYLERTPFANGTIPKASKRRIQLIEPDEFEHVLLTCRPVSAIASPIDWVTAGNRAILWVLFDTGIRVSELCELRVRDVDREQGFLRIGGDCKERRITLSPHGRDHLLCYLEQYRSKEAGLARGGAQADHLFLSER